MKNNVNMAIKGTWPQFHDRFVIHKNYNFSTLQNPNEKI